PLYLEVVFASVGLAETASDNKIRASHINRAFLYIEKSMKSGALDRSKLNEDPRLRLLRQDPRYLELKRQF
ncbi:MAG: hypothetical protein P1V97_33025, partial [Planctomycetota bacterium]|nr:hypothetical protein [Planctomycetota bacterium]